MVAIFESRQPPSPTLPTSTPGPGSITRPPSPTLTTSTSGPGSITPDCSHGCPYPEGALVSLTARPDPAKSPAELDRLRLSPLAPGAF